MGGVTVLKKLGRVNTPTFSTESTLRRHLGRFDSIAVFFDCGLRARRRQSVWASDCERFADISLELEAGADAGTDNRSHDVRYRRKLDVFEFAAQKNILCDRPIDSASDREAI